ncbi:MAG: glycoside hydrolase family 25 protein [Ruminococcus flavefaciens]|nr:glycoside hydrolase family 25 protein [Ruminococcus flavefaciens]
MITNGIDVSQWQGIINWQEVKTDFCIMRAGYGRLASQRDKFFDENYNGCKNNSIPCGAYWYSYALTPEEAVQEANACMQVIKGKKFEYPIYFDVEEQSQFALGKNAVSSIIRAFMETLENAGYWTGLYMSSYYLENYTDDDIKVKYALWVADYTENAPTYDGVYGMWQKSATGTVNGIDGDVDLDECYVDYPEDMKTAGLNGYDRPPDKKTVSITATIDGVNYSGELTEI